MSNFKTNDVTVSNWKHSYRHKLSQFSLIVDFINVEIVEETPLSLICKVTERTDSVMNRGRLETSSFEIVLDKEVSDV